MNNIQFPCITISGVVHTIINQKGNNMNTAETLEKMTEMRLFGMKQAYDLSLQSSDSGRMTNDELITLLVETEYNDRQNRTKELESSEIPLPFFN